MIPFALTSSSELSIHTSQSCNFDIVKVVCLKLYINNQYRNLEMTHLLGDFPITALDHYQSSFKRILVIPRFLLALYKAYPFFSVYEAYIEIL